MSGSLPGSLSITKLNVGKQPAMVEEHLFESREELISVLTDVCKDSLTNAVAERGNASLLVSGGSTPEPLYNALANTPLAWDKIGVAMVDERWVEPTHPRSNEAFVKRTLVHDYAADANFIVMKDDSSTAAEAVASCNARFSKLAAPFDVTILGMGPDGHTASLFPDAIGLEHGLDLTTHDLCCAITAHQSEVTGEETERMTLTLHGILQSRQIILLITGEDKLEVYKQALQSKTHNLTPVSAVLQQKDASIAVYWAP